MPRPSLSPRAYRRVAGVAVLALAFIIVTGGAVRLTDSGLGCPTWPNCEEGSLVPVAASSSHAMVEFVNRVITGLVSLAVAVAVLGSLVRRPRRRDLTLLSLGLVAGVLGQVLLGGLTVLFELAPPFVMAHFLLSLVLLANAVVLHHRAGQPEGPARPLVAPDVVALSRLALAAAALVAFTGTVVTGSGPHGGDPSAERLPFLVPDVARLHGISVVVFLALVLSVVWRLRAERAPTPVQRSATVLLAVLVAQATVGYAQYFTGVPVLLVGVHIAGAAAVWAATVRLNLDLTDRVPRPAAGSERPPALAGA